MLSINLKLVLGYFLFKISLKACPKQEQRAQFLQIIYIWIIACEFTNENNHKCIAYMSLKKTKLQIN